MALNKSTIHAFLISIILVIIHSGCGETFEPFEDRSESPFSMFGFLDASADTQWVRVIPIRDLVDMPPEIPEMIITIEDLETGEIANMEDSLFQFRQEFNVVNSWSTVNIQPEKTYRLTAKLPNGLTSRVTVTTPKDFPMPDTQAFNGECSGNLRISGVENLADVKSVWHIRFYFSGLAYDRVIAIPYRRQALDLGKGQFSVIINSTKELSTIADETLNPPDSLEILSRNIFVASAGPEWDDEITSLTQLEYSIPNINSNVENGVGYLIGIVSKTIPMDHCY